jgi:hypothetical protein
LKFGLGTRFCLNEGVRPPLQDKVWKGYTDRRKIYTTLDVTEWDDGTSACPFSSSIRVWELGLTLRICVQCPTHVKVVFNIWDPRSWVDPGVNPADIARVPDIEVSGSSTAQAY